MHIGLVRPVRRPVMIADKPDGAHAKIMRRFEIARHVLDHHRAGGIDAGDADKPVKGRLFGLWHEFGPDDIEDVVEMMPDAIGVQDVLGMRHGAVGEDMLAPGKRRQHGLQLGLDGKVADIDVMHEMQIILRRQPLLDHQPAHGRAIAPEQILLDHPRLVMRYIEMLRDKFGDPHGDAHEQVRFRRIDGVVEIEHPVIDAGGGKAGWRLGLW